MLIDASRDHRCEIAVDLLRLLAVDLVARGVRRIREAEDFDTVDVDHVAIEQQHVGILGDRRSDLCRIVVARHEDIGRADPRDELAHLALDGIAEGSQVTGVEHRGDVEFFGELLHDLERERIRVDIADVQNPYGLTVVRLRRHRRYRIEARDLRAEDVDAVADRGEVLDVPLDGVDDLWRPFERTLELRFVERLWLEVLPGDDEEERDRDDTCHGSDRYEREPAPGNEGADERSGDERDEKCPLGVGPHERFHARFDLAP